MRIGIFTDTYHPSTNGIVFVIDIIRGNLQKLGHEVIIFAPETRLKLWRRREYGVIRFPAIEGIFFDEQSTSFFFPPTRLRKIQSMNLDVVLILTPSQIALMGAYAALGNDIPLYFQYSTDLISYIEQYPSVIPGVVALLMSAPFALRLKPREVAALTTLIARQRNRNLTWRQDFASKMLGVLYDRCDGLIAVSPKTALELKNSGTHTKVVTIPTGVNSLPMDEKYTKRLRTQWLGSLGGPIYLYVGRMGAEKNLDLLIDAFKIVAKKNPQCVLVMVGGFSYRDELEKKCAISGLNNRVLFIGRIAREKLGSVYAAADIFCFPSVTDTQALVLNEAAHAGLPLIWCDKNLNAVLIDKKTGLYSRPNKIELSNAMLKLAENKEKCQEYGMRARSCAKKLDELTQAKKLAAFLES